MTVDETGRDVEGVVGEAGGPAAGGEAGAPTAAGEAGAPTAADAGAAGREARHRLFVGIEVPPQVRAEVDAAVAPLRARLPALRWTDPATWHLTVGFVGSVEVERAAAVDEAVGSVAAGSAPVPLRLSGGAGTFGGGVLYAAFEDAPVLVELAGEVADALRREGFELDERPLVPHLTLARVPRGTRLPAGFEEHYAGPTAAWTAERLVVVRSRLQVGGAAHSVRSAHPLGR